MNIKAIRLFLHVMQRGSLVAAANELNTSPSAASRLLAGLERETGLTLFSRDRQRLEPTAEGQQYFTECYRALTAIDELPRAARRLASGAPAKLRLVAMPRFTTCLLLPAVAHFVQENADVEIDIRYLTLADLDRPLSLSFDVGVATLPFDNPAFKTESLFDMPYVAVMSRNHDLARRKYLRASTLAGERLITFPGSRIRTDIEDMFAAEGVELRPHFTVISVEIACQLVLQTGAIVIAEPLVPLMLNTQDYALVPIRPSRLVHIGIVESALEPATRLTAPFKASLREEARRVERRLASRFGHSDYRS